MKKVYLLSALIVIQLATCSYRDKLGTTFFGFSGSRHEVALNKAFRIREKCKAERGGFEPPVRLPPHSISSAAQSAALSPLRLYLNPRNPW
jgi:hypothetical protein